jgi:hypothetical protein
MNRVIFRKWRTGGPGVIALFPDIQFGRRGLVQSYMHVGQHGPANYPLVIRGTTPAKPEEYADLKAELERIGYVLKIAKRQ